MRKIKPIIKLRKLVAVLAVVATAAGSIAAGITINPMEAKAAKSVTVVPTSTPSAIKVTPSPKVKENIDYVDLRMVLTTDLHGMLSSMDYITGKDFKNGGLSRAYNLIQKTRNEKDKQNVFTFDAGDVLFEASMEYIMGQDEEAIQPIYMGMSLVGYDAITLGNHDFDYGKNYILRQLSGSGLIDKVVVSNLTNARDGSHPFHENMLIERQALTHSGKRVAIKVGIIGETIPTLSKKTDNYTGIWNTEDIVENVKKQTALLKSKGADVIVVVAHSGFGDEEPQLNDENVSYALTKIEDVDVILCGHEHNEFPTKASNGKYYNYPGVDPVTGLVNGKIVVMAKSNARSIGVADLTLSYREKGGFSVEKKSGEVRRIADYKLQENSEILSFIDGWKEELETYRTQKLIELEDGFTLQNYLGLLGDNEILQLQNNARIAYARKYIETTEKSYAGYPVIAAASHISYGLNSEDDYVSIKDNITYASLFSVQNYRNYTLIYKITGAQLKEWLELSASAYSTFDQKVKESQLLIQPEWMEDWSQFYVFDGINYKVNPYVSPRYDISGKKINNTRRVTNITYNGKVITDDMELIIASNTITPTGIFSWANTQKIKGMYRTQNIIAEYLMSLKKFGKFTPNADHNWTIDLKEDQEFLMLLPNAATEFAKKSKMYKKTEIVMDDKTVFKFQAKKEVTSEPQIVALQSNLEPTMKAYDVFVDAFSSSGIKAVKYGAGEYTANDAYWNYAREVANNKFSVFFNDTYTIFVEDNSGKRATYKVIIDNIGVKEMATPKVWSHNNTKTKVTGRAEAGAAIYVELKDKTYEGKANSDGSYSIAIPSQMSGTTFFVYAEDKANERKSDKAKVYVKYNGPNKPTVDKYYNNSQYLTGKSNQKEGFIVVVDEPSRQVFVNKTGGKDILLASTEVDYSTFGIMEVDIFVDDDGNFKMDLPNIEVKSSLRVFNMDYMSRVGVSTAVTVMEGGPYAPTIKTANDAEDIIYGNVVSVTDTKMLDIVVTVNEETYNTVADKQGNFKVYLNKPLVVDDVINAYAIDHKGIARKSKTSIEIVESITTIERSNEILLSEAKYNSSKITVTYLKDRDISLFVPYLSGSITVNATTDQNGIYVFELTEELTEGALVKVTNRNNLGNLMVANYTLVTYKKPAKPIITTKLTNSSKQVKVVTKEDVALYAVIQGEMIESLKGIYKEDVKGYEHVFKFERLNSGTKLVFYAMNVNAKSSNLTVKVEKTAPDAPKVSALQDGSLEVTGTVELILLDSDKMPTVKNTKTKVYAKIKNITYVGSVKDDGSFTIKVPKLKAGMEISVCAYNIYGYGPIRKLKV